MKEPSYISLTSAVASQYFNLVKFDKLIKDQEELVKLQTEIVRLEEIKYKNGLCPVTELMDEKTTSNTTSRRIKCLY